MRHFILILCSLVILLAGCADPTTTPGSAIIDVDEIAKQTLAARTSPTNQPPTELPTTNPGLTNSPPLEPTEEVPTATPTPDIGRVAGPTTGDAACIPPGAQIQLGLVTRVIDGDTIEAIIDGKTHMVRYIGVDAPEIENPEAPVEYMGPEAQAKNQELVEGQVVTLVKDVSEIDQDGCLLRYIFVGDLNGVFVNYELIRLGYAVTVIHPPDVACGLVFQRAERTARGEVAGLWKPAPAPTPTPPPPPPAPPPEPDKDYIYCDCCKCK